MKGLVLAVAVMKGLVLAAALLFAPSAPAQMIAIPGGSFVMGDDKGDANEAPRLVSVARFRIMRLEVTNRQFAAFVAATAHRTDPERRAAGYVWTGRWRLVAGAHWRAPHGPGTSIAGKPDHAVVQVSQRAARGGDGRRYPWGDAPPRQGPNARANFGTLACCAPDASDGFARIAPVGSYPSGASPYGALDMAGNVWEWTASRFPGRPGLVSLRGGGWGNDPYCLRTAYRHANPPDIGLAMVGFRFAADG